MNFLITGQQKTRLIFGNVKCWNSKYKKHLDVKTCINGSSDNASIAESFRVHLSSIYNDTGNQSSTGKSDNIQFDNYNRSNSEVTNFPIGIETVELAIKSLKLNKAAGHDGIVSEHIMHSHPALVIHLKILFSMILKTGHVPDDFGKGIVIPISKDKSGNPSSIDNYRPITLSSVISKVFEHCLISLFSKFIVNDNLQFGFKPGIGCSHSIFSLFKLYVIILIREAAMSTLHLLMLPKPLTKLTMHN
jgi:hypothetical protein